MLLILVDKLHSAVNWTLTNGGSGKYIIIIDNAKKVCSSNKRFYCSGKIKIMRDESYKKRR